MFGNAPSQGGSAGTPGTSPAQGSPAPAAPLPGTNGPAGTPAGENLTTFTGQVIDQETGEPVVGAFVSVGNAAWSSSALTDIAGRFAIPDVPAGEADVVIAADLFQPLSARARIAAGAAPVVFELQAGQAGSGEVVVITGDAPDAADPPKYNLDAEAIRTLPGSGNDTLKALQSMPGVARQPFGLGGLVLRGSSPRDSNVYLDGVEVPLLYHFGGLASFYPSAMLGTLELVPGGFSSRYGRAQGGVVTMTSKPGRSDRWRVASEASLIDASVRADGPGPGGGSWSLGLRRSYVDAVLAAVVPEDSEFSLTLAPRYYDGQLRYELDLGGSRNVRQSLSVMLFGSDDRLQFLIQPDEPGDDGGSFRYVQRFVRAAVRWKRRHGPVDMSVTPWIGTEKNEIRFDDQGTTRSSVPMGLRAEMGRTFTNGYVSGGLDLQGGQLSFYLNSNPPPMPGVEQSTDETVLREGSEWYGDMALWMEGLYKIAKRHSIKPGLRGERYGFTGEWVIDPRLNLAHEVSSKLTIKESLGVYHQPPVFADLDPAFGNPDLTSSYSVQASIGADMVLPAGIEASVTGFYDQVYDMPVDVVTSATSASEPGSALSGGAGAVSRETTAEQFGTYAYQENVGRGRNYGVETLIKASRGYADQPGSYFAWIAYTYSRSLRRYDPARYMEYYPYVLDQPHVLTALASMQVSKSWRIGARIRFASGNPYTPVDGAFYDVDTQQYRSISGEVLSDRLPSFFQLDVRLDRRWKRSWGTINLFLDVQNVTNRINPEGVNYNFDYSEREFTRGLPVFPSIGVEYQP